MKNEKKLLYDNVVPRKSLTGKSKSLLFFEETKLLQLGRTSLTLSKVVPRIKEVLQNLILSCAFKLP